jgi:uncharacterized repeat protein (TIGR03803 family)
MILLFGSAPLFAATESVVYTFGSGGSTDGSGALWSMVQDANGNLYGTSAGGAFGGGLVYKLTPDGSYSVLHSFCPDPPTCTDGYLPGPILLAPDGNIYGTTVAGGPSSDGTIFRMTTAGSTTVLYSFGAARRPIGLHPLGLALGLDGNFYGITEYGGTHNGGVIYKMTPSGRISEIFSTASPGTRW